MTITVGYILLALGVSAGVGMVAGIYPAFKASRLDPIIALTRN
jgi:ABC-type antimicrobial peptide transport system permease subunit